MSAPENENPQPESTPKEQVKRLWSGFGSFISSVKQKTLDIVDNLQDQITELDEKLVQPPPSPQKERKEFDMRILPILESATTYIEEPQQQEEYQLFQKSFTLDSHSDDIALFTENSPNLRRIRARLVPSAIPEEVFWCRLFFKLEMREKAKRVSEDLKTHLSAESSPIKTHQRSSSDKIHSKNQQNEKTENDSEENDVEAKSETDTNPKTNVDVETKVIADDDIDLTPEELAELENIGSDEEWNWDD